VAAAAAAQQMDLTAVLVAAHKGRALLELEIPQAQARPKAATVAQEAESLHQTTVAAAVAVRQQRAELAQEQLVEMAAQEPHLLFPAHL
jgi:hypothetical protein